MNWSEAIQAMRAGHTVRRQSDTWRKQIEPGVIETGQEGCRLLAAWTVDDMTALVFAGSMSRVMFVPDDEHRAATDWAIE
jgi:hypothetical protein